MATSPCHAERMKWPRVPKGLAEAIADGALAEADFDHATGVHQLLDRVRQSSDEPRAMGVST